MKLGLLILLTAFLSIARAQTLIDPVDDGWMTSTTTDKSDYIIVGNNVGEGALVFSTSAMTPYTNFSLEINPEGTPLFLDTINVYGYTSTVGTFSTANYAIGQDTLLGSYSNLSSLSEGQEDLLNISSFVHSVQTSYFGILLVGTGSQTGPDVFSSTHGNDGTPSGIVATPEPSTWAFLLVAFSGLFILHRFRRLI